MEYNDMSLLYGYNYNRETGEVKIIPFVVEGCNYSSPKFSKNDSSNYDLFRLYRLDTNEQFIYCLDGGTKTGAIEKSVFDGGGFLYDINDDKVFGVLDLFEKGSKPERVLVQSYLDKFVPNSTYLTSYQFKLELELIPSKLSKITPLRADHNCFDSNLFNFYLDAEEKLKDAPQSMSVDSFLEFCENAGEALTVKVGERLKNYKETNIISKKQDPISFGDEDK